MRHSFRHAGICTTSAGNEPEFESKDDLPLIEWVKQFNISQNVTENLRHYIEAGKNSVIAVSTADQEILDSLRNNEEEQGDEENEMNDPKPPPSIEQALKASKLLEKYFFCNADDPTILNDINKIQ